MLSSSSVVSLCWLVLIGLSACASRRTQPANTPPPGAANTHMHRHSFADLVRRFDDPARDAWQHPDRVIAALGPVQGLTVADLGAGTGYFSFRLARAGARVVALDVDPRFVDLIRHRADSLGLTQVEARQTPADSLNLAPHEADVLLLVNVYHHLEDRVAYFRRARAGLKPEGQVAIVDFKKGNLPHGPPDRLKLSPTDVGRELQAAGWQLAAVDTTSLPYQYIVRARPAN